MFTGLTGGLYKLSEWITKFAYVNILWALFSLLGLIIFGFFPATAAMFTVVRKWIRQDTDIPIFKTFWTAYKKDFLKSNLLGLILCVLGYILYLDYSFIRASTGLLQLTYYPLLILIFLFALTTLYVFPVFVHYEAKLLHVLRNAFLFTISRPINTLMIIVGSLLFYYLVLSFTGFAVIFGASIFAFFLMWTCNLAFVKTEQLIKQYTETQKELD